MENRLKMRMGIVGFCNLNIMQYLYKYTNILDEENVEYDVIYWNRLGIEEEVNFKGNLIRYDVQMNTYQPFYKKLNNFIKYAIFLQKMIKKKRYDKLIILTTQTAIPICNVLLGKYKGNYIFDYRDITKEYKSTLYKKLVHRIINNSFSTMMSSQGFIDALELNNVKKIQIAHNTKCLEKSTYKAIINKIDPVIKIVYWGIVRQKEHTKKVCDCFGGDSRFQLIFHGRNL